MEKDLEEIILKHLKYLEPLNEIVLSLSPIFLLFGFSEFSIYSIFIAKDPSFILNFSSSFEIISFYYALFLIIFVVFLLVYPLLLQVIKKLLAFPLLFQVFQVIKKLLAFPLLFQVIKKNRLPQILKNVLKNFLKGLYFLFITILILFKIYIKQGGFFILPIIGYNLPIWISLPYYLISMGFLYFLMKFIPKFEVKDRIKAILFLFIIIAVAYTKFLIITPLKLSKLGYFEAILTLEKEYMNQPGFQACLKMCQTEGEREKEQQNTSTYNSNQHQDIQNNNYQKLFFVFLRTSSEYIVGCSKHSNVRIYIPSDKVIAIKYVENQKTRGQKIQPNNDKK